MRNLAYAGSSPKIRYTGAIITPRKGGLSELPRKSPDNISIELLQQGENLEIIEPWSSMKNIGTLIFLSLFGLKL